MEFQSKLLSSLEKVFFTLPEAEEFTSATMLKNEIYSFQWAMWVVDKLMQRKHCRLEIESELAPYIQVRRVDYVPSILPAIVSWTDDDYITKTPGMFPDPLKKLRDGCKFELASDQARSLWFTVEPKGEMVGTYPIKLRVYTDKDELIEEKCFTLEILDVALPALPICATNWFHGDCIAKLHNVEVMSEEYFALVEKYIAQYTRFGHNMILTPIFTPPLDTAIGGERPTNQLVAVTQEKGVYSFDFTLLKRWISLCHSYGIRYFEISHLFTQWGAKHAPKIMATVDGEYKKIFGWETEALGEEYRAFLDAFLPELVSFLKAEGIMDDCFFHVSDEPHEPDEEQYRSVQALLLPYIPRHQLLDALSSYSFYEKDIVQNPVVSSNNMHTFMDHGVKDLWTYYCVGQRTDVSNRFMALPSYRNRILGAQLYKYQVRGFLHWGFNFWFTQYSTAVLNPYVDTSAGGAFTSGDSFVTYPVDEDGDVVLSFRLHVFNEGLQDLRALYLLESLTDRETVLSLLEELDGFEKYPRNSQYLLTLRHKINEMIKTHSK